MFQKIIIFFSLLIIVIGCVFLANGLILAWSPPSSSPPNPNVSAPLNVGATGQSKSGGLVLNTGGATTGLVVDKGRVGIGTASPSYKLQVDANTTGWGTLIRNLTGTNNYVYMNHGTNGMHIRNDSAGANNYLLDVYASNGKRFQVKGDGKVCIGGDCRSSWPSETNLQGWSFSNDYFYDDGEEVIRTSDEWLRLNQANQFTNGVYTPGKLRADGGLYVGDDEYFWRDAEDRIATNDSFYVRSSSPATYLYSASTYLGAGSGDTIYVRGNTMRGNYWYMEDNGLRLGSQSSPGSWELYVDGQVYVSDYLRADGGIHVGGSSNPGTGNLIVDGSITLGGVSKTSWPSISESDTLQSVTNRGASTNKSISVAGLTSSGRISNYGSAVYVNGMSTYVLNTQHLYPSANNASQTMYLGISNPVNIRGYVYNSGGHFRVSDSLMVDSTFYMGTSKNDPDDMYLADKLYDWDNTDYYIDPNGVSNLNTLNTQGRLYAKNGVHIQGDWLRVDGNAGIYFQSYGGGWYMTDTTWIRAYNNKNIYTGGDIATGQIQIGGNPHGWPDQGCTGCNDAISGSPNLWLTAQDRVYVRAPNGLELGGGRITNVAKPVNAQDAATKAYVDAATGYIRGGHYGICARGTSSYAGTTWPAFMRYETGWQCECASGFTPGLISLPSDGGRIMTCVKN